jgi:predicted esterase
VALYDAWMNVRFDTLPSRLQECAVETDIAGVPCLLVRKDETPRPFLFWMHGRTADKELDPGRYLRCVRRGINVCAVDLPGHGSRFDAQLQERDRLLDVILQMASEIDSVLDGVSQFGGFDLRRMAIGGMSAGGMIAITRMLQPHKFSAAILESTGGAWEHLLSTPFCEYVDKDAFEKVNPMNHLDGWRDIPIIAFHSRQDAWVPFKAESDFIEAIRMQSSNPEEIELVAFDHTGAPDEHIGFGRESTFVKEVQVDFLARYLLTTQEVMP